MGSKGPFTANVSVNAAIMLAMLLSDSIEANGVSSKWVANPIWTNSIVFNENRIASVIATFTLMLGVNGP